MNYNHSTKAKDKIARSRASSRWINNGVIDMSVPKSEAKSYMEKGWKLGRISLQDRKWVHDGNGTCKCVTHEVALRLTYLGWFLGRG